MISEYDINICYSFSKSIIGHYFSLYFLPENRNGQRVHSRHIVIEPYTALSYSFDCFKNSYAYGNLIGEHTSLSFKVSGEIETFNEVDTAKGPLFDIFSLETPLTRPGVCLSDLAKYVSSLDYKAAIKDVFNILDNEMEYVKNTTFTHTSAEEAISQHKGVCQDYTHIAISLFRSAGFKAKYVNGIIASGNETHAWLQLWTGNNWISLDPTLKIVSPDNYITLSSGRDFSDTALEKGVFYGPCNQREDMQIIIKGINEQ